MSVGMLDEREWLAAKGLAKPNTRGRFSNDAKEALAKARAEGVEFIDKKAGGQVVTTVTIDENGKQVEEKKQVDPFAPHLPASRTGMLDFVGKGGKKHSVNATEACHACNFSFGWCKCDVPTKSFWRTGEILRLASRV